MPPPLLLLQDISLTFGVTPLLSGAGLAVAAGDRICLVGRNGSGKSTLLRIAAGLVQPDAGYRFAQPGATIHYLPQEPDLSGFANTLAFVDAGFSVEATDGRHRALYLLRELGLSGKEDPASLSGGEARRAALARALAPSPDILLLDEPTNHLDLLGIEWLERELVGMRSGIVLISHDRRLLERISRTTIWLDYGARATRGGSPICTRSAESGRSNAPRRARSGWMRLRPSCPAGWSRLRRVSPNPTEVARSCEIFRRGSCAATGSASSAPTALERRHYSTCSPAH